MSRPSANLDKKMLEAGIDIIIKEGLEGLTARNICYHAGVNLGMFSYYFKNKDYYISLLFSGLNKEQDDFINIDSVKDRNSLERLKYTINKMHEFGIKHRELSSALFSMFSDINGKYEVFQDYISKGVIPVHDNLVYLITEARSDGYLRQDWSVLEIFSIILFGILIPDVYEKQLEDIAKVLKIKKNKNLANSAFFKRLEAVFNEIEVL